MRKLTKVLCFAVAVLTMFSAVLSGCGANNEPADIEGTTTTVAVTTQATTEAAKGPDISKPVKLTWAMYGDPNKDFDAVAAKLNEMTKKDLNAEVAFSWISWGDMTTKYPLMLMSGEELDLVYGAAWNEYQKHAQKGSFLELTQEMLDQYMPSAMAKLSQQAWTDCKVDGKLYGVPRNYQEYSMQGLLVRGDLMKKAGLSKISTLDDVTNYFQYVKTNVPELPTVIAGGGDTALIAFEMNPKGFNGRDLGLRSFYYYMLDDKPKVVYSFDDPIRKEALPKIRDMYTRNLINKNVLNVKTMSRDIFRNGQAASGIGNDNEAKNYYGLIMKDHPDWDMQWYPFAADGPFPTEPYNSGLITVPASSKNPDRAMMLMDKFFESSDYYMTLIYGIEGKHWEYTTDKKAIQVPAGTDPTLYTGWAHPWGFGDWLGFNKASISDWPGYETWVRKMAGEAKESPLRGITINTESFKNELAAIDAIEETYGDSMNWGVIEPEKVIADAMKESKAAGLDKVMSEIQKQIDAFVAAKK